MGDAPDGIQVNIGSLDTAVVNLFHSLNIKLARSFESITAFRTEFSNINDTLQESGLIKHVTANISLDHQGRTTASILAERSKPSYSIGANINQKGQPTFEANMSIFPSLPSIRPVVLQASANSTYPSGGSLSASLVFPRLHQSIARYAFRIFSEDCDLAETVQSKSNGFEFSAKVYSLHEFNIRFCSRTNAPKPDSHAAFYENYGLNRLRSDRFSLIYKFCIDKTRYLKDRPSVPTGGWSFAGVVDVPVVQTDADNIRVSTKASKHFRLPSRDNLMLSLALRSGMNFSPLSGFVSSGFVAPVAVNDKFFLGGAAEDLVQFPGFRSKGAGRNGAVAFSSAQADVSFDLSREAGVRASVFLQSGVTCPEFKSEGPLFEGRISVGASLLLPMGPRRFIRVLAAKPLLKTSSDQEQLFLIGINLGNEI